MPTKCICHESANPVRLESNSTNWQFFPAVCCVQRAVLLFNFIDIPDKTVDTYKLHPGVQLSKFNSKRKTNFMLRVSFMMLISLMKAHVFGIVSNQLRISNRANTFSKKVLPVINRVICYACSTGLFSSILILSAEKIKVKRTKYRSS